MKIACVVFGTRGDVQPMIALAAGLNKKGHEVIICAPPENEQLVKTYDCQFMAFGPEIRKWIRENPESQKSGVVIRITPSQGKQIILNQINQLPDKIRGVDLVLGAGIVIGLQTASDILKVPYRLVAFYPIILGAKKDDPLKIRLMFGFGRRIMNLIMKGYINRERSKYRLSPIKDVWRHWMGENVILAYDKELNEVSTNSEFAFTQTGFMLLPDKSVLPAEVEAFLNAGKPPVYIGFGSNPVRNAGKYNRIFEQVREETDQRLIISKGWAEFPEINARDVLYVDDLPFSLLFPRLAAIVYHGGTGTMAAASRAGIPQAAFPFMGDQFDNRKQIVRLGLGPETCDFKNITTKAISTAISECITEGKYRKNAVEIAKKLQRTNGVELTIQLIEKILSDKKNSGFETDLY